MKILVIEDEHRIANYIKKGLEIKSYVVDVAYDGEEGFALAAHEKYDLLILDRMLPSLDGLEVCRKLRSEGNHLPILMLTAKTQVDEKVEGLDAGADDYLTKPFAFTELLARIRALSRRPERHMSTLLIVDDLILDTTSYQVKRGETVVPLSKKEYALLEFLVRHKGKVYTKDQLAEQVWSYDSDILGNTVQVYIGYLRNKIDLPFKGKTQLIETVRGFGYRLKG